MSKLLELHQINFGKFQDFLLKGDLSVIGEGTEEELNAHAIELHRQYSEAIGSDEDVARTMLTAQIKAISFKLDFVQRIIDLIKIRYDERLAEILIDEGFDIEFSKETLIENLEEVISQCQQDVFQKKDLEQQLEKMDEGGSPVTYKYFADVLVAISIMVKANITGDNINTLMYCRYHKQLYTKLDKPESAEDD